MAAPADWDGESAITDPYHGQADLQARVLRHVFQNSRFRRIGLRLLLIRLLRLVLILHYQRVQVLAAANLELRLGTVPLDLDLGSVLATGDLEETADLGDLLGHPF